MTKLEEFKTRFAAEVNDSHIDYEWDAGWCYNSIKHPLMEEAFNELSMEDYEEFSGWTDEWLSEHSDNLYHMADVVDGKLVTAAETLEGEEAIEYAKGLIGYIEKYAPKAYAQELAALKKFVGQ